MALGSAVAEPRGDIVSRREDLLEGSAHFLVTSRLRLPGGGVEAGGGLLTGRSMVLAVGLQCETAESKMQLSQVQALL